MRKGDITDITDIDIISDVRDVPFSDRAGALDKASDHARRAVDTLREAGALAHLPRGLLARAKVSLVSGDRDSARADLDEVLAIARRDRAAIMKLHEAACEKLLARL